LTAFPANGTREHPTTGFPKEATMKLARIARMAILWALASAAATQAQPSPLGTLDATTNKIAFSGTFENPLFPFAPGPVVPELCTPDTCQEFELEIGDVGEADVAIAVGWTTEAEQIDLYVYGPDGSRLAGATGLSSEGRSIALRNPAAGTYRIQLAGSRIDQETYRGIAQVQPPVPQDSPARDLLPRLLTPPPKDFHVNGLPIFPSTSIGFAIPQELFPFTLEESCYVDEVNDDPRSHRCLRFTNDVVNVGEGPLEVEFRLAPNESLCEVRQVIRQTDNSTRAETIEGGCELHANHVHFHFLGLAGYELYDFDADAVGFHGALVATGRKVGFCLTDGDPESANDHTGRAEGSTVLPIQPQTYRFPNCNLPARVNEGLWNVMGVSPGWGDVYTWDLPDQYIEVTGLEPGKYDVVSIADPGGVLLRETTNDGAERSGHQWVCLTEEAVRPIADESVVSDPCPGTPPS
jgi:hypothetical protein